MRRSFYWPPSACIGSRPFGFPQLVRFAVIGRIQRAQLLNEVPTMSLKELAKFLHRYRAAYTAYLSCVHSMSDACQGRGSVEDILSAEEEAYDELGSARQ